MRRKLLTLLVAITVIFIGCGQPSTAGTSDSGVTTPNTPLASTGEEPFEPDVLSPGQINASMINQTVKVKGKITFVNKDSGGLAIIVTGGDGQVMVRVENRILEAMTEAERSQYVSGKTITFEGMLVRATGGELTVVLGVTPASAPQSPQAATIDIIAGPVKISNNPIGYREWPFPRIFIHQGKLVATYWGIVNDWKSTWATEFDGNTWSQPKEIPTGTPIIGEKGIYVLSAWQYTQDRGNVGVVVNVLDESFKVTRNITVDTTPTDHDIDKNSKQLGVVDSKGVLHLIWERNSETATDIYYARFDGANLTEPVSVSNTPQLGSVNPSIAIDGNDLVYAFWGQFSDGMYGGDIDIYYSCLKDDNWSEPKNISRSNDWMEFMAVPWYQYANGPQVNLFYMATSGAEAGPTTQVVMMGGEVLSTRQINFGFGDIALVSEGDKIHAVFGGMGPVNPEDKWTIKGEIYYNYFDGHEWFAGAGEKILPRDFYNNAETLKLDVSSIGPDKQAMVILENGSIDYLREIHPYAVSKDGIIHTVFEYNQHGTYDAYYMAFKQKAP